MLLLTLGFGAGAQKIVHLNRYAEANAALPAASGPIGASTMVLLAGINDIAQNMGDPYVEDVTYANILSMVDLCWQNGIRPVICGVLPSYNLRWRPEVTDTYEKVLSLNARLKAYCERHGITYIDYGSVLAGPDGKIQADYSGDTVHPNAAGYELMEKLLLETLK